MSGRVIPLPDGRPALFIMQWPGMSMGERVARAAGCLEWLLPDKDLLEAVAVRLPDWPPDVWAWQVTQRSLTPITWPGHDPGPVAIDYGSVVLPTGPKPWEALLP